MQLSELPNVGVWYVGSPYTKYTAGIWPAYKEIARIAGLLVREGLNIYSPIAHSHPLAHYANLDPLDHALWMRVDAPFCALCGGLIVATMKGWEESQGVGIEIAAFKKAGKPIFYLDPVTLEIEAAAGAVSSEVAA